MISLATSFLLLESKRILIEEMPDSEYFQEVFGRWFFRNAKPVF